MYESELNETYEGEDEGELGQESYQSLEAELAGELLEVSSEEELDRFLGKLAGSVLRGAGRFIKSPVGKALGGVLRTVAKTALPAVGGALGSMVLPGAGTAIGAKLGSLAGGLLEVGEAEQLGEAEAEYEAALRYVRFARAAVGNAARAPRDLPPRAVVRAASVSAARRHAPSLLRSGRRTPQPALQWRQRRRHAGPRRPWYPEPAVSWTYADDGNGNGNDVGDGGEPEPWVPDQPASYEAGAPAAASSAAPAAPAARAAEGRWVRRGGRIVVLGV